MVEKSAHVCMCSSDDEPDRFVYSILYIVRLCQIILFYFAFIAEIILFNLLVHQFLCL